MTGAQSRAIARLRKKHPGLEWSTTRGVRVRYVEGGINIEKVITESGIAEDPVPQGLAPREVAVFDLVRDGKVVGQVQGTWDGYTPAPPFHFIGVEQ